MASHRAKRASVGALLVFAALSAPAHAASLSIQVVNPDAQTAVRVFLDRKLIHDAVPERSRLGEPSMLPALAGVIETEDGAPHALVVEAAASGAKARFEWTAASVRSPWLVIRYYPGRSADGEPAFFTFSLQAAASVLK